MDRPVAVIWNDAYSGGEGWFDASVDSPASPVTPVTVGFMLPASFAPGHIVIADTFFDDDEGNRFYSGMTYIPSGMIVSTTIL